MTTIKFSKMYREDATSDRESYITIDGKEIGCVTGTVENVGTLLNPRYRVTGYTVELWDANCKTVDTASFRVPETAKTSASVLAMAKRAARRMVAESGR